MNKLRQIIKETVLMELNINDPVLVRHRAKQNQKNQYGKKPDSKTITRWFTALDKLYDKLAEIRSSKLKIYREMDMDPDIELSGGPVADKYGDQLNVLDEKELKIRSAILKYEDKYDKYLNTFVRK